VEVVEVRPGDIRTGFNRVVPKFLSAASPYHPWASKAWEASDRLIGGAPDPERVAEAVVRLLRRRKTSALERCGAFFQVVAGTWGARLLPRRVLLGAIRRYYGLNLRA
jgi:NAD(P)-dependent dehydrogenase (short-subunit alcohol dehydrogenase family)